MIKYRKTGHLLSDTLESAVFLTPFFVFIVLLSLSFFAGPAAEDLSIYHYDQVFGVREYIGRFYHSDCSRYFSFPLVFFMCHGGFLLGHYYIVPLVLLLALWSVLFFFVRVFTGLLPGERIPSKWCAWLSMVLLLAIATMLFEIPSMFYWLSGSMTYLLSFVLFVVLATILLREATGKGNGRGNEKVKSKMSAGNLVFCLLLTVCIVGSNEIALYFLVITLLWGQGVHYSVVGKWYGPINWLLVTVLLCFIIIIIPGGTAHRAGNFKMNFHVAKGLFVALEYTVRIFFRALAAPLGWLCLALAYLAGTMSRRDGSVQAMTGKDASSAKDACNALAGSIFFSPKTIALFILVTVYGLYFLVYVFSAELLPPRANNLLLCFVFFFLLAVCYSSGIREGIRQRSGVALMQSLSGHAIMRVFVFLLLITSSLLSTALQNVVSGSVYKRVMSNREKEIGDAKMAGIHRVVMNRYEADFDSIGAKTLPGFFRGRFAGMGGRRFSGEGGGKWSDHPELIHYQDPLADTGLYIHYYAEYHHIDTINYGGVDYQRIGLMEKIQ
jgi:small basic protein